MIESSDSGLNKVRTKHLIKNKSFSKLLDGMTISTVIIILIAVAMLYLTNITVDLNMSWKDFGYEAAILYIFTVTINFLSRSIAKRKGRETEEHKKAYGQVEILENEIIEKGLRGKEGEYCRAWETEELRFTREALLSSAGLNVSDFEKIYIKYSNKELKKIYIKYSNKELTENKAELALTDFQLKVIKKVRRIKRLNYDERYLSTNIKVGRRVSPAGEINTSKFERLRTVQYLITALFGVCLSASLALDIIVDPTFGTVVMCIIKILTILISAVAGMIGGYKLTAEMETAELSRKSAEQKNFLKWCGVDLPPKEKL